MLAASSLRPPIGKGFLMGREIEDPDGPKDDPKRDLGMRSPERGRDAT